MKRKTLREVSAAYPHPHDHDEAKLPVDCPRPSYGTLASAGGSKHWALLLMTWWIPPARCVGRWVIIWFLRVSVTISTTILALSMEEQIFAKAILEVPPKIWVRALQIMKKKEKKS